MYSDEVDIIDASEFGEDPSGPIFMDNIQCGGDESALLQCAYDTVHMCSHNNDIGIICHRKYNYSELLW